MVYKKRVIRRKRIVRRKRKMVVKRVPRTNFMTHAYNRWEADARNITLSAPAGQVSATHHFALNFLPQFAEFTNLYDQYMIYGIKAIIQLVNNPDANTATNTTTANLTNFFPKLWYCFDRDDDGSETISSMKERVGSKCRILRPNSFISIFIKPSVRDDSINAATGVGYRPMRPTYVDCGNVAVKHYGIKYVVDSLGLAPGNPFIVKIEYKYYFKMKQPR